DAPAVVDARGVTSWVELDDRVTRLVHALRDRGLEPGDCVVAMLGNQVELVELSLACATGGWVLVPLNWHWVPREVVYVLGDAEPSAVVVDERYAEVVTAALAEAPDAGRISVRIGVGERVPTGFEPWGDLLSSGRPGDVVDGVKGGPMFYTSGTTGNPKGVRSALTAVGGPPEMLTLMAHSMGPALGTPPAGPDTEEFAVQLVCGPMYHSAQWVFAVFTLLCGATVVLQHRFDAGELLDLVDEHGVTNLHLVPTQISRLLDLPDDRRAAFDGGSLRSVLHGAAPCPPSVKRAAIEWWGPIVTEYYGGTEGGFLSVISASEWLERPGSVGRPMPVVEVRIVGDDGTELPPGETGDIWFRNLLGSDFEYHNAPDKTASAHRDGGFGTLGDVGHVDAEGYLHLSDRKIDMVVSGGVNIYPAEVEGVLAEHPAVADVAVFGIPEPDMGESVHAALSLRSGWTWDDSLEAELDEWCRANLAGFKRPRSYEVHDELPRNEVGKLAKRPLRDPWWADRDRLI
ncbi:MAG: AMP-binding protein, partial [Actinomycetota bacterium]